MSNVLSDLKHGLRVLLRTPLFTICTIAALAIGIGATTALFSVVHALLIRPLPYHDADSLVVMWEHNLPRNRPRNVISPANFLAWRERSRSFERMAALQRPGDFLFLGHSESLYRVSDRYELIGRTIYRRLPD